MSAPRQTRDRFSQPVVGRRYARQACLAGLLLAVVACGAGEVGDDLMADAASDVDAVSPQAARCVVTPTTPAVGESYTVVASGLSRNKPVRLELTDASGSWRVDGIVNRDGQLRTTAQSTMVGPGSVAVFLMSTARPQLVARCAFTVVDSCGDGVCASAESCASCADDCGACDVCGDGACSGAEDCQSCAADCCPVVELGTTPSLDSVVASAASVTLTWTLPPSSLGLPAGGFDLVVDGIDLGAAQRALSSPAVVGDLGDGTHCFMVEARWTQITPAQFPRSAEVCVLVTSLPPPPPSTTRAALSLRIDPAFDAAALPSTVRTWYDRAWAVIRNPNAYPNPTEYAMSNDTYKYGRGLNTHITALLSMLRVTGDRALLDEVDRLAQLMRAQLRDWSITTYNGSTYQADGYLNWLYFYDAGYEGTDAHEMDEALAHTLVAAFTRAFQVNADLDPRYAERAEFWTDYLVNHFEAKWRDRKNIPTAFPFLVKKLAHVYVQWARYHTYMADLTGRSEYRVEAERMAEILRQHFTHTATPLGDALQWTHGMPVLGASSSYGSQPMNYARYTVQGAADLACEGLPLFAEDGFMASMATTVAHFIMHDGAPNTFAGAVDGTGEETLGRFAISPFTGLGRWDASGRVVDISAQAFALRGSYQTRELHIPAGMVFALLR